MKSNQVPFEQLQQVETEKGLRLAFISTKKGQPTSTLLAAIITSALDRLPIPKRMRWGASRAEFVRPMHWLLVLPFQLKLEMVLQSKLFPLWCFHGISQAYVLQIYGGI